MFDFCCFESIQSEAFMIILESQRNGLGHPQNKYRGHPEVRTANPATFGNKGVGIIWVFRNSLLLQHMSRDIMISCKNSVKKVTSLYCILLHVITPIHTCRHVVLCRYSGFFLHTKNDLHFPSRKLDPSIKKELPAAWGLLTFLANFIPNIGGPVRNLVSPDLK